MFDAEKEKKTKRDTRGYRVREMEVNRRMDEGRKDAWRRGEREVYKELDSTSFLSVSKQLTIEGQRRRRRRRRQYGNTEFSFIQPQTHRHAQQTQTHITDTTVMA